MSYGINIENGKKHKCPNCNSIYAISNDDEILYRNLTLLYFSSSKKDAKIKCKQCKGMIKLDFNEHDGKILEFC